MYNAEKYVGDCLDSLLAQTFEDFEVIVVDDCSTDNSAEIVKSYIERFDGRLKYSKLKANSGGAPVPRNRGIKISSGEYLYFMDSDDALMPYAFKDLYTAAKNFNADVVHCERYYTAPGDTVTTDITKLKVTARTQYNFVTKPTLETNDLEERLKIFMGLRFWWTPWAHLIRRDLIIENDIEFPRLSISDDVIFSLFVYCLAGSIVRITSIVYVYRTLEDSNCRVKMDPAKLIRRRGGDIFLGIKAIEELTNKFEFFKQKPDYKYFLFDFCLERNLWALYELYGSIHISQLNEFVQKTLNELGNDTTLTAYFFSKVLNFNIQLIIAQQKLNATTTELQSLRSKIQSNISSLEKRDKINKAYIAELENFVFQSQRQIGELEKEIKRLKGEN